MKFKIDENLPIEIKTELKARKIDACTVYDQKLQGYPDPSLLKRVGDEGRILLTLDKGIANIQMYNPIMFHGIVLFRPDAMGRGKVLDFIKSNLDSILKIPLEGKLVVVSNRGIRVR